MARSRLVNETPTILRKIQFYRANVGNREDGRDIRFDPSDALNFISDLPFNGLDANGQAVSRSRYHITSEEAETLCIVDQNTPNHRIRLANVRRTGLPYRELVGNIGPLGIPAKAGIVEPIHVVFFPENIVGLEFNFHGPRIGRLRTYLTAKSEGRCQNLTFSALLRQDSVQALERLIHLKSFRLRIHAAYADRLSQADESLGSAFRAAGEAGGAEEVEIILRPQRRTKAAMLADEFKDKVRNVLRLNDLREQATAFAIAGVDEETGERRELDLLSDQLISRKRVKCMNATTRVVDSESVYAAIEEAYDELRDQLMRVPGVEV